MHLHLHLNFCIRLALVHLDYTGIKFELVFCEILYNRLWIVFKGGGEEGRKEGSIIFKALMDKLRGHATVNLAIQIAMNSRNTIVRNKALATCLHIAVATMTNAAIEIAEQIVNNCLEE